MKIRNYFLWASVYLLVSMFGLSSGFSKQFEMLAFGALVTLPPALAIWYQLIAYRHYQSMDEPEIQFEDENGASQLL